MKTRINTFNRGLSLSIALVSGAALGITGAAPTAFAAAGGTRLDPGQSLQPNQALKSPNGQYHLFMQSDGNFVLYGPKGAIWSAHTRGKGNHAVMQTDGNLVVYSASNRPLWYSGTWNDAGASLALQDDGNLVLYRKEKAIWATNTYARDSSLTKNEVLKAGGSIVSSDDRYALSMMKDGNLVLFSTRGPRWATGTTGTGNYAIMQEDGNLVVYDKNNKPKWASNTHGKPGTQLYLQTDGNLVLYQGKKAIWHTHTGELPIELHPGERLRVGDQRFSPDGKHRMVMQGDGNLVLYGPGGAVRWATYTQGNNNFAAMQGDGNFVVYTAKGVAKWATNTAGKPGALLKIGNDGVASVVLANKPLWQSKAANPQPNPPSGSIVQAFGPGNCAISVDASIKSKVEALLQAANSAGLTMCGWGWRSAAQQIELRRQHCGSSQYAIWEMPASQCSPPTAPPGQSRHERGLAIDFTVGNSTLGYGAHFQWMKANAAKYGLMNLPSETWHWSVDGH